MGQPTTDLLGAPPPNQLVLDHRPQLRAGTQLGRLGPPGPHLGQPLGPIRPIPAPRPPIAGQLPPDRRLRPAQPGRHRRYRLARHDHVRDLQPLLQRQVPPLAHGLEPRRTPRLGTPPSPRPRMHPHFPARIHTPPPPPQQLPIPLLHRQPFLHPQRRHQQHLQCRCCDDRLSSGRHMGAVARTVPAKETITPRGARTLPPNCGNAARWRARSALSAATSEPSPPAGALAEGTRTRYY